MPGTPDAPPSRPLSSCPSLLSPQDSSVGPDGCASDPRARAPADPALAADAAAGTASMTGTPRHRDPSGHDPPGGVLSGPRSPAAIIFAACTCHECCLPYWHVTRKTPPPDRILARGMPGKRGPPLNTYSL